MSRALHVLDNSFHLMRPFRRRRASTAGGLTGRSRTGHNGPCGWSGRWPPCDLPTSFGLRGPKQSLGVPSAVLDGVGSLICSRSLGPFCLALCSISGAQAFFSAADDALSPRCAVLMNCVPARRACALCLCGYWTGVHGCPPRLCPRAVGSPTALSWRACSHPQRSPPPMMGSPGGVGSPLRGRGGGQPAHPQYANYWAPLTRKRHIPPHPAQPQHTNRWAPRMRQRHQQEHRPRRPTERSDPTQHAKGRTGDSPWPRKGATTRRNVTRGGGGGLERGLS